MSVSEKEERLNQLLGELVEMSSTVKIELTEGRSFVRSINKIHAMIRKEKKVTNQQRSKLKTMHTKALKRTENEYRTLKAILAKIQEMRNLKDEIKSARGNQTVLRRGVLMSLLQENAKVLPLWLGAAREAPPPLVGCIPAVENYVCRSGDKVAARVTEQEEENWILAEVVRYNANTGKYEVDDVDAEEGKERYWLCKTEVLPLPLHKADPEINPEAIFAKGADVLALYPQTTCFYKAMVEDTPKSIHDEYRLIFEDPSYPEGFAPSLRIPQRYVIRSPYSTAKDG